MVAETNPRECTYCKRPIQFTKTERGWRSVNPDGSLHNCDEYISARKAGLIKPRTPRTAGRVSRARIEQLIAEVAFADFEYSSGLKSSKDSISSKIGSDAFPSFLSEPHPTVIPQDPKKPGEEADKNQSSTPPQPPKLRPSEPAKAVPWSQTTRARGQNQITEMDQNTKAMIHPGWLKPPIGNANESELVSATDTTQAMSELESNQGNESSPTSSVESLDLSHTMVSSQSTATTPESMLTTRLTGRVTTHPIDESVSVESVGANRRSEDPRPPGRKPIGCKWVLALVMIVSGIFVYIFRR